jgi:hypothetical protein
VFVKLRTGNGVLTLEYLTKFSHGKGQGPSEQGHPGIMAYELGTRAKAGGWSTVQNQIPRRWSLG